MNILVLNWRDITHPWAGGAELNIHEQMKRWVEWGHKVTLFCGAYEGCKREEEIDGIHVIRRGGRFTVYLWAFLYYCLHLRHKCDIIVDLENGIPFFTPLYSCKPKICLIHHIHTEQFKTEFHGLFTYIGIFLESIIMPIVYRNVQFIAISGTTREELERIGVKKKRCQVVHPGLDHHRLRPGGMKSPNPTLIYLGRLMAYKRLDILIKMMPMILQRVPNAVLHIVGLGPVEKSLKKLAEEIGVEKSVVFHGYVSEERKVQLLQQAWVFVMPSMNEGWGLSVIEANACGTPAIAFNVPGLCEAIDNPYTGLLVESEEDFSQAVLRVLQEDGLRAQLSEAALRHASKFSWDETASQTLNILSSVARQVEKLGETPIKEQSGGVWMQRVFHEKK
ncbi:MAG: glycosyltransferase family 4 protein [Anaerolineae bacterium]